MPSVGGRGHAVLLWVLATLFLIRVVAQPLALIGLPLIPSFDAWYSGVVPYGGLLVAQLVILAVLVSSTWMLWKGRVSPRRRTGVILLVAGSIYGGVMIARLVLGATILRDHSWFARPLPTVFHLVLAGFLLVYGHFHFRGATR
jgi:hypothetical protein